MRPSEPSHRSFQLAHVLFTGVRRRRDLAVLKTLGLTRSQLLKLVSWQASALATVALLAGLPLGALAGRWSWALFAGATGVPGQADIPLPLVLLAIPLRSCWPTSSPQAPDGRPPRPGPRSSCAVNSGCSHRVARKDKSWTM